MHAYRAIIAVTMAAALVITSGLTALSLVVGAIHLIFGRHPPRIGEVEGGSRRVAGIAGAAIPGSGAGSAPDRPGRQQPEYVFRCRALLTVPGSRFHPRLVLVKPEHA